MLNTVKLTPRFALFFIAYAAALLALVAVLAYRSGQDSLRSATISELNATSIEKQAAIDDWLNSKATAIHLVAADPSIVTDTSTLVSAVSGSPGREIVLHDLVAELRPPVISGDFLQLMLVDVASERVAASTDPAEVGQFKGDRDWFLIGKAQSYVQGPYDSISLGAPAMTASAPVRAPDGSLVGVLAGRINLNELQAIMNRGTALHQTEDSYLINRTGSLVTQPRFLGGRAVLQPAEITEPLKRCLAGGSGVMDAPDYHGRASITSYRWMPDRQLCLIDEIDQSEAYAPARLFGATIFGIFVLALGAAILFAVLLARGLTRPILALQAGAARLGAGDLDARMPEASGDELGMLAQAFNRMAQALAEQGQQLRTYSSNLEKRVEQGTQELRTSEERFHSILDNLLEGCQILGFDWRYLYVNDSVARQGKLSREELLGHTMMETYPGIEQTEMFAVLKRCMDERARGALENEFAYPDGSRAWFELIVQPSKEGIFILSSDITERKQAEQALRKSEEDYRRLFDSANDAILIFEPEDETILEANAAACATYGFSHDEFLGMSMKVLTKDVPGGEHRIQQAMATGTIHDYESVHFTKSGEEIEVSINASLIEYRGRTALLSLNRNITQRKRAEQMIERQVQRLATLRDIDQLIVSSFSQQFTLNSLLVQVTDKLQVDAAAVLLLNPHMSTLRFAAGSGFRRAKTTGMDLNVSRSIARDAVLERRVVHVPDIRALPPQPSAASLTTGEDFVSFYAVPLVTKGEIKGVMEIFHRSALYPDDEWRQFLETLAAQAAIAIDNTQLFDELQRSNLELSLAYSATIEGWSRALDLRDKETEGHTQRVTAMTVELARSFGLRDNELVQVRYGALLHDIGKMGVPDHILLKPGPLTEEEWKIMRKHPTYAYELLAPIRYLKTAALHIPYCHHEKWDGSGYPRGLKGEEIPLTARIFAIVDIWDALTSERPYRAAWTREAATAHIREISGTHLDPRVVDIFLRSLEQLLGKFR